MMSRILHLSDGQAVRAIRAGPVANPLLVLFHGVGMRAEAWAPQMAALAADTQVIAVDLPGHGGSDPLPGAPELSDYTAWAAMVVRALGLGAVSVAGHSMGALISAGLAIEHPDLVRRVALLNAVHRRNPEARAAVRARATQIAAGAGGIEAPLARWFSDEQSDLRDLVAGWLRDVPATGYASAYHAFANGDATYADRLGQIRCPFLALTGDGDANSTPDMTKAMAAMAPHGRAVVIAGHRHMVNLTAPGAVTAELRDWLAIREVAA